jgi:hypothetical protein
MLSHRVLVASCLVVGALTANPALAQPAKAKDGPLGMKYVALPKATFYMGWDGKSRVEEWRGGLGEALRVAGSFVCRCPSSPPCSVSTPRSSNRTCGFAASGSRTRTHAFAHKRRCGRPSNLISRKVRRR